MQHGTVRGAGILSLYDLVNELSYSMEHSPSWVDIIIIIIIITAIDFSLDGSSPNTSKNKQVRIIFHPSTDTVNNSYTIAVNEYLLILIFILF